MSQKTYASWDFSVFRAFTEDAFVAEKRLRRYFWRRSIILAFFWIRPGF
jgi:hypothetical protein